MTGGWGFLAAMVVAYGVANLLQSIAAANTDLHQGFSPRLLWRLGQHRAYLFGIGFQFAAFALAFLARRDLPLFLVQSAVAAGLGVTAILGVLVLKWKLPTTEILLLALLCFGLAGLIVSAQPMPSRPMGSIGVALLGVALVVIAVGGFFAVRMHGAPGSVVLGSLAGLAFGAAANPLVVLHLVGGVHLDALLTALAALTVFAAGHRVWIVAGLAAAIAFTVKATGAVLIAYVLSVRARTDGVFSRRTTGTGFLMTGAVVVLSALIPNGWGWLGAMDTPGLIRHPYDPATVVGWLLHWAGALTPWTPDLARSVAIARVMLLAGGAVLVVRLLWLPRRPARAGTALQVTALVAPTVHAWYLTWGLSLAGTTGRWAQQATVAVCVALCFTAMPETLSRRPAGIALTVALLVVALAAVALPVLRAGWTGWTDRVARMTA
ncbi:hypothetical protein GCM10009558_059850 [Virgisporangium aurantiacum]